MEKSNFFNSLLGFLLVGSLISMECVELTDQLALGMSHNPNGSFSIRTKRSVSCNRGFNPSQRIDCGWHGVTQSRCTQLGCCFDSTNPKVPNCFIGMGGSYTRSGVCDFRRPSQRRDCGYPGINQTTCESRNCCFDNRVMGGVNHCFISSTTTRATTTPTTTTPRTMTTRTTTPTTTTPRTMTTRTTTTPRTMTTRTRTTQTTTTPRTMTTRTTTTPTTTTPRPMTTRTTTTQTTTTPRTTTTRTTTTPTTTTPRTTTTPISTTPRTTTTRTTTTPTTTTSTTTSTTTTPTSSTSTELPPPTTTEEEVVTEITKERLATTEDLPTRILAPEPSTTTEDPDACDHDCEYVGIDCHNYYTCVNYTRKEYHECNYEHGLAFNPAIKVCDRIENVEGCRPDTTDESPSTTPPTEEDDCICEYKPHETDCSKYYFCLDSCRPNSCQLRACPGDLLWSVDVYGDGSEHQQCSLPGDANCVAEGAGGPRLEFSCYKRVDGLYRNERDCRSYWKCQGGKELLFDCPKGYVYNWDTKSCDFAARSLRFCVNNEQVHVMNKIAKSV